MAKVTIILDKRTSDNQGRHPIKLRITCNKSNTTIGTNVYVRTRDFIGTCEHAVARTCANARQINAELQNVYFDYMHAISELERSGRIYAMTAADIREYVNKQKEFVSERTFSDALVEYRNNCRADKTKQAYDYTKQMMERCKGAKNYKFEEIDFTYLTEFENWMIENNIGASSRSIVFRNMRTIYNYAINNGWVDIQFYPFRKFKIKQGSKEKVYLPEDKMRQLLSLDLSNELGSGVTLARDFFILSFLFCGINPIDLYNLPRQSKQISFVRQKINFREPEPIHIGIQPEAECLISERQGEKYLLNLAETYCSYDTFYYFIEKRIKTLGGMIGCPELSLYWARYSWATYASKIDIPDYIISKALGHADSTLAQKKYISFDWTKVDRANRRVIDYILFGKV